MNTRSMMVAHVLSCAKIDDDMCADTQLAVVALAADERIDISSALTLIDSNIDMLLKLKASLLVHESMRFRLCRQTRTVGGPARSTVKQVKAVLATRPRLDYPLAQPGSKGKGDASSAFAAPSAHRSARSKGKGAGKAYDSSSTQNDTQTPDVGKKTLHLPATASLKTWAMYTLKREIPFATEQEADAYLSDFRQKEIFADAGRKSREWVESKIRVARRDLVKANIAGNIELQYCSMSLYLDRFLFAYVRQGELTIIGAHAEVAPGCIAGCCVGGAHFCRTTGRWSQQRSACTLRSVSLPFCMCLGQLGTRMDYTVVRTECDTRALGWRRGHASSQGSHSSCA
eukprot:3795324-Amphidinium_carterae.1